MKPQSLKHFAVCKSRNLMDQKGKVIPRSCFARVASWLLSKTSHDVIVKVPQEIVSYNEFNVDSATDMIAAIFSYKDMRMAWENEIDRVVVGRSHFEKILKFQIDDPIGMQVDMRLNNGDSTRLVGIFVQCVPWIDGFAIIPKVK